MCHRWGSIFKKPSVNPQRVICGHMTSPKVTIHFWLITFDRSVIQPSKQHHCISPVNTDRMICNMTYLGQVMTLIWGQILFLNFLGHIKHHSTRPDELDTMVVKSLTYTFGVQSYNRKTKSSKFGHFDLSWPLEAKPFTWGPIWEHTKERSVKGLSNAFFTPS